MRRLATPILLLNALLAAACEPSEYNLRPGDYEATSLTPETTSLASAKMHLDEGLTTAMVTLPDDSVVTFHLTRIDKASWETCAPGNYSKSIIETMIVSPSPLTLGGITFHSPQLTAACSTIPQAVLTGDRGDPSAHIVLFFPR